MKSNHELRNMQVVVKCLSMEQLVVYSWGSFNCSNLGFNPSPFYK